MPYVELSPTVYAAFAANVVINGDFRINQTGYVSAAVLAAAAYGHDQWKAGAAGGDYSFTQLKSSTQITIASGKSLIQPIEDVNVAGGSYVLTWTGTAQARAGVNTLTPSGSYAASPLLISGQTAGTVMSVEFNAGTLGTVKLESGSLATPFVMRPLDQELLMCQRYFEQIAMTTGAYAPIGVGQCIAATAAQIVVPMKVTKRAPPTLLGSSNPADYAVLSNSGAVIAATVVALAYADLDAAMLAVTVASGLSAGNATTMHRNNAAPAKVFFSARL
jgi:hypothetical protein